MDRSEKPRPNSQPRLPESEYQKAFRDYENGNRGGMMSIVFTHPSVDVKSIGTLLYDGCMTHCGFDRGLDLYESILKINDSPLNDIEYEMDKVLHPILLRKDRDRDLRMRRYYLLSIFACSGYGVFFISSIGYKNDLLEPFCDLIRTIADEGTRRIRIVYLTSETLDEEEQKQFQQFRSCYDLGDTVVKIEDLEKDPMEFLLKFRPQHYPNRDIIDRMMSEK